MLPVLPGTLLVWAGIVLGAWIDDFARISMTTLAVITVLAVLGWALRLGRPVVLTGVLSVVTVIEAGPCPVLQVRGEQVQLGYGEKKALRTSAGFGNTRAEVVGVMPPRIVRSVSQ